MTSSVESRWRPGWSLIPGEVLVEALEERGMTQTELARRMARPLKTISEIANGKAAITAETAIQLERALGMSASFWNGLESRYRESLARDRAKRQLHEHANWIDNFPLSAMQERGLLPRTGTSVELMERLLHFFEVSSPAGWDQQWGELTAAFRASRAHSSSRYALATWLRWGEVLGAQVNVGEYDRDGLINALHEIRAVTRKGVFVAATQRAGKLLSDVGVALVIREELPGMRVSGAARWLRTGQPLIQLSLRYRTDDHFWFSLFHEAGHIAAGGKRMDVVEDVDPAEPSTERSERIADAFARDLLIPASEYRRLVEAGDLSASQIRTFAAGLGIAPGIVVGRLQHDRHLPPSRLNHLKRNYPRAPRS